MNSAQTLTTLFLTVYLSAASNSLAVLITEGTSIWKCLFILFLMFLRTKIYFDDLISLKAIYVKNINIGFEIPAGIISWFFWLISAHFFTKSCFYSAITVSIALIIATSALLKRDSKDSNKKSWEIYNLLYILLIFTSPLLLNYTYYLAILNLLLSFTIFTLDFRNSKSINAFID